MQGWISRNGETDYNKERRWQGSGIDVPLNETGVEQAKLLAERVAPLGIEHIYSSHLKRAYQTAQAVADKLGIGIEIHEGLREGCLGQTEGLVKAEVEKAYPEVFSVWYAENDIMDIRFPGGESKQEIQDRVLGALESLLDCPYQVIGISSHSAAIRYSLRKFGLPIHRMENTALYHLIYDNGEWILEG